MRGFARDTDYEKACCGTCKYHQHEDIDDGWVCVNDNSYNCAEWTDYNDYCEEYVSRKEE